MGDGFLSIFDKLESYYEIAFQATIRQLYFPGFAECHPGLEHQAGVPKGGTFLLVFKDRIVRRDALRFALEGKDEFDLFQKMGDAGLIYLLRKLALKDEDLTVSDFIEQEVIADF